MTVAAELPCTKSGCVTSKSGQVTGSAWNCPEVLDLLLRGIEA